MTDHPHHLSAPYPGLRSFEEADHPLFFGRETQVVAMLRLLSNCHFAAVVGSSGSGKSSLVRAGLIPAVRTGFLAETKKWLIVPPIKPGRDPYGNLAAALFGCLPGDRCAEARNGDANEVQVQLRESLKAADQGLLDVLASSELSSDSKILLVIDQFEELFAFRRSLRTTPAFAPRDEAAAFVSMLLRTCEDQHERVWVVVTMRSDSIGDCEAFLRLPEKVSANQFLVPRLDRRQMAEAICGPSQLVGHAFAPFGFDDGFMNQVINDAGDRPDQLPLMQHALMRAWKAASARAAKDTLPVIITLADYKEVGRIRHALSQHANDALREGKVTERQKTIAQTLFLLLCDVRPDGQIVRRRPLVSEVAAVAKASVSEIEAVVRLFQEDDRNFLLLALGGAGADSRLAHLDSESVLDISHEVLLRQWDTYRGWQEAERERAAELRWLADCARLRQKEGCELLGEASLERVAKWRYRASESWAVRYVDPVAWKAVQEYINESEREVARQRRKAEWKRRMGFATIAGAILLAVALWFLVGAQVKKWSEVAQRAETEQTRRFVAGIGADHVKFTLDETTALWELAELPPESKAIRSRVLTNWFGDAASLKRALVRGAAGLHCAVGLRAAGYQEVQPLAAKLLNQLTESNADAFLVTDLWAGIAPWLAARSTFLTDPANWANSAIGMLENTTETDPEEVSTLCEPLAVLVARMDVTTAVVVADRIARALENPQETNSVRLSSLGAVLASLAGAMDATDAGGMAERMARALENPQETNSVRLSRLGEALAELAGRMDISKAAPAVSRGALVFAKALENPQETNMFRLSRLGEVLAELARQMDTSKAAPAVSRGALVFTKALENPQETDWSRLSRLGTVLALLARRMDATTAAVVAEPMAKALENPQERNSARLSRLGAVLASLAGAMDATDAGGMAERMARALENPQETNAFLLSSLGQVLAALAGRLDATTAAAVAEPMAKALENPQETNVGRVSSLGEVLAALTGRMAVTNAGPMASRGALVLARNLAKPQGRDPYRLYRLGRALARLAGWLDSTTAATVAEGMARALEHREEADSDRLASIATAVAGLAGRLDAATAAVMAERMAKALEEPKETDSRRLASLSRVLAGLAGRLDATTAAMMAERIAKALENPKETDSDHLANLSTILAGLTGRLDTTTAAVMAERMAKALEEPEETDSRRLASLSTVLAGLTGRLDTTTAAVIAERMAKALEKPKETDSDRLASLSTVLAGLAGRLDNTAKVPLAEDLAKTVANSREKDPDRLSSLGGVLAALAGRLPATNLVPLAELIAKAMANRQTGFDRLQFLGATLAGLTAEVPGTDKARLVALSYWLSANWSEDPRIEAVARPPRPLGASRTRAPSLLAESEPKAPAFVTLSNMCSVWATIAPTNLVEVLKWPFCVGEPQKIVLAALGKRTGWDFGGDVWKFVEQVDSLGIPGVNREFLDLPAKRPRIEDAIKELETLASRRPKKQGLDKAE